MGQAEIRNRLAVLDTARNALDATEAVRQVANQLIVDQQEAAAKHAALEREVAELRQVVNGLLKARDAATVAIHAVESEASFAANTASTARDLWFRFKRVGLGARLRFVLFGTLPK